MNDTAKGKSVNIAVLTVSDTRTKENDKYLKIVSESMSGSSEEETNKNYNKIIAQKIQQRIDIVSAANNIVIGEKAPDFTAPNPDGKAITMSAIKGKVTIIDFWASWCKPCRIENPNLVKLYDKYHSEGLEIISVSLERGNQKAFWIDAIKKDQLSWYNVSNLKFWQDPIAKTYSVNSIPATFILDENGMLIAERLRGRELEAKIKSLLE